MTRLYREEWFGEDSMKNFRLARIRVCNNLSMRDLSMEAGISLHYYSLIECMECYPSYVIRKKISSILKEDINYLFPKRFKEYCEEHRREIKGVSEDVLDKLNRVRFNSKAFKKTPDSEDYQELVENEERDDYIKNLLNNLDLPEITREVFNSRFGFEGRKFHTLEELGKTFHATKQRAKQRELEVIEKLKEPARLKKLTEFL